MRQTTPDRRQVPRAGPSLWWLLLVPVLLLTGTGTAIALAAVTIVGVIDEALDFGPEGDLPAGELTVWVARAEQPERVRLVGPSGTDLPLTPVANDRDVSAGGVHWTPGYTATITEPGRHRVEATGGRAALRAPDQLHTDAVRRNGIDLPILVAAASVTASVMVAVTVLALRAINRRRSFSG